MELAKQRDGLKNIKIDMKLTQISFILLHGLSQFKLIAVIPTHPHGQDTLCGQG
jgi:hypothetical protein